MKMRAWAIVFLVAAALAGWWAASVPSDTGDLSRLGAEDGAPTPRTAPTRSSNGERVEAENPPVAERPSVELELHLSSTHGGPSPGIVVWLVPDEVLTRAPLGVGGAHALESFLKKSDATHVETDADGIARFAGVGVGRLVRWVSFQCRPTEVMPPRDAAARLWSEEIAGVSGPLTAGEASRCTHWTLVDSCAVIGELVPCEEALIRLLREGKPSDPEQAAWTQERYRLMTGEDRHFRFDGVEPGSKLLTIRFEDPDGTVGFAAWRFEVHAGTTHDVGLLSAEGGLTLDLQIVLRDEDGGLLSHSDVAIGPSPPRVGAVLTTQNATDIVDDILESFRFGIDGRARLMGLPRGKLTICQFTLQGFSGDFEIMLPMKFEVAMEQDTAMEIPAAVRRLVDVRVFFPIRRGGPFAPRYSVILCLGEDGPARRLSLLELKDDGVLCAGRLPAGTWRLCGHLTAGERAYVFDRSVEVMTGSRQELRVPVSEAAWLEGEASPGSPVFFAAPEEAARNEWPFFGIADEEGHFRAAVPARSRVVRMNTKKTVLSGDPGKTVFVD